MPVRRVELGPVGNTTKDNIRALRTKRSMTQAELANAAGLPSQAITEIENGARRVNVDDLVAIASALKVKVERLLK